jgi:hypothetical protein
MVLRWAALVLLSGFTLTACASKEQQLAAAAKIETHDDQFKPYRQYKTGTINSAPFDSAVSGRYEMELISQVDRATGARGVGLQFTVHYFGSLKREYREARTPKAQPLQVRGVLHKKYDCTKSTGQCIFVEEVMVDLHEADLRAAGNDGYVLKLFPKFGEGIVLTIPKSLVASLYAAVDAGEKQVAAVAQKQ